MRSLAALLALVASALAYSVTEPTTAQGWSVGGPNIVAWNKVSTDQANFTILLVNQVSSPPTQQVLAALVDGSKLSKVTVNPPSGGFKAGKGYQVNLVKDSDDLNTILAQSNQFDIVEGTNSTLASAPTTVGSVLTVPATTTAPAATTTGTTGVTDTANPTSSNTSTSPQNNGASSMNPQAGLFAGLALLGAFLA